MVLLSSRVKVQRIGCSDCRRMCQFLLVKWCAGTARPDIVLTDPGVAIAYLVQRTLLDTVLGHRLLTTLLRYMVNTPSFATGKGIERTL